MGMILIILIIIIINKDDINPRGWVCVYIFVICTCLNVCVFCVRVQYMAFATLALMFYVIFIINN